MALFLVAVTVDTGWMKVEAQKRRASLADPPGSPPSSNRVAQHRAWLLSRLLALVMTKMLMLMPSHLN